MQLQDFLNETEINNLSPEERFLWKVCLQATQVLKKGLTSTNQSAIVEAVEVYDWFFKANTRNKHNKLRIHDFKSVCSALGVDHKRIQRMIVANPEFPSRAYLIQKLGSICGNKRKRKYVRNS